MTPETRELRILELYSGIGGMHYAAKLSGKPCHVVWSIDINTSANAVYRHNFPQCRQQSRNIESLSAREINSLKPDVIMMSPPCQPFTRVGLKMDVKDSRCASFLHLLEVLPSLPTVRYILMENVVGFETSQMRDFFIEALERCKFHFREYLLSPDSFGIPNSRKRYYLTARKIEDFTFSADDKFITKLPISTAEHCLSRKTLNEYLEELSPEDLSHYLLPLKVLSKYAAILDVRQKSDSHSCCFTKAYGHYAEGTGSVLQHNSNVDFHAAFQDFTKSSNVESLEKLQLRYFTPQEISRLMGFPEEFSFPSSISNRTRYRVLGNSLNVYVVSELFKILVENFNDTNP
nr:EOG090X0A4V [Eulimnadia texana]